MIIINYNKNIIQNVSETLAASDIAKYLRKGMDVAIKPNLVVAQPASMGATTHPEVVEGIILFLRDFGAGTIRIIESSWIGDCTAQAFKVCGYDRLAQKYGVNLTDLKSDASSAYNREGYELRVCNAVMQTDFLINVPVLKAHCQTKMTCCLKNLKGCIPDSEKRRFHAIGLHKPIAALAKTIKVGYNVIDGICGDLAYEGGGDPVESGRIIAGRDPLLLDSFCAELIGYNAAEIEHLAYAREMGLGEFFTDKTLITELNPERETTLEPRRSNPARRYQGLIIDDKACSACYSALIYALQKGFANLRGTDKIYIGQGFKGKTGKGLGIGDCAAGFTRCAPGCPPRAADVAEWLQ
jgi:uncharacterized protein (DUF362 family)